MWHITAREVMNMTPDPGGDRFTDFVDSVIRAQAHISGIPDSNIHTNLRTNVKDGGVDTRVESAAENDESGWLLGVFTIWQYKAVATRSLDRSSLIEEINKNYAKERIVEGYAYRFCVCDSLTDKKKTETEAILNEQIKTINPDAPDAKVLSADDLAAWVNRFPSLVIRYFRPKLADNAQTFESWRESTTAQTNIFIPVPHWEPIKDSIVTHVDFSETPASVDLAICGDAGAGKTRLTFESLSALTQKYDDVFFSPTTPSALATAREPRASPSVASGLGE